MAAEAIVAALKKKYGAPERHGAQLLRRVAIGRVAAAQGRHGGDVQAVSAISNHQPADRRPAEEHAVGHARRRFPNIPDLDAVHAPSDSPARGIVTALQQKGKWKKVGEQGHVIFVNIDGEPIALQWIGDGYMDAVVSQDPIAYAQITVEMLDKYAHEGSSPFRSARMRTSQYFWEKGADHEIGHGPEPRDPAVHRSMRARCSDKRHWGNIAYNEWGLRYKLISR